MPEPTASCASNAVARWHLLLLFVLLSVATLAVGGWLTALGMGAWYDRLAVPPWQPPGWLFGPVWTALLTALAIASWLVSRRPAPGLTSAGWSRRHVAMSFDAAQLVLNMGWSLLFFALQAPTLALVEIVVLDAVLVGLVWSYGRLSRPAACLVAPYLAWVLFATAINTWIVLHN